MRKHGLIIGPVALIRCALASDIGRERHPPCPLQQPFDRLLPLEQQGEAALVIPCLDYGGHARAEIHPISSTQSLCIAHKSLPPAQINALVQCGADARLSTLPFQLSGDYTGIVKHEAVTRAQQARQILHMGIA